MKRMLLLTATLLIVGLALYLWVRWRHVQTEPEPPLLSDLRAEWQLPALPVADEPPKTVVLWMMVDKPLELKQHTWYHFSFADGKVFLNASKSLGTTHHIRVWEGNLSDAQITADFNGLEQETPSK